MKKFRSILAVMLALAMVCTMLPVFSSAADFTATLSDITGAPGDEVTMTITMSNFPTNVGALDLNFSWDTAVLTGISATHSSTVAPSLSQSDTTDISSRNDFYGGGFSATGLDMNGELYTLKFKIPETATPGTYNFTLIRALFATVDYEYEDTEFNVVGGTITVTGGTSTPIPTGFAAVLSDITGAPGDEVDMTITMYNFPTNVGALDLNFSWDTAVLTGISATHSSTVAPSLSQSDTTDISARNDFYGGGFSATGLDMNGEIYTLKFKIPETATPGTYSFTLIRALFATVDYEYEDTEFAVSGGKITVEGTAAPTEYNVTVNGGTSDVAKAEEGATVTITAAAPATGMVFDKWTVVGGGVTLANANSASTTFTMGTADVEVTATYKAMAVDVYVTNGTYTGTAAYGQTITITADAAPTGKTFDKWVVTGGNVTLANANAATTTFTMGTEAVQVQATYKNVNYTVAAGSATGGSITTDKATATYGETVTITVAPSTGKKLASLYYTVEGSATQNPINTALKTFTMPAANVTVYATFADITGITITGDYRGEAGDEIYTGDTDVTVDFTVSDNAESIAMITFTLDIEAGLTNGAVTFTAAEGLEIADSYGNTYSVWAPYSAVDMTADSFKLGTVTVATVDAKSSANDAQYKVSMTINEFMVSDGNADAVDATVVDGTVYVSKTVASIKFYDKSNNYSEFTAIEVDETVADKDGYVADYINTNVAYKITYTDGTTDADYTDATADMFADLTTDVTDSMVGGDQATITGTYTQTATNTPVSADVAVSIALNETVVDMTVVPETLYFKLGETFAWGNTQYTLIQANSGTVAPNAVSAGILAGTLTDNSAALDNTSTAKQTVTVTYADDTTITDTVDVYFVAASIKSVNKTVVYYEDGATFAAANSNFSIVVSYNETTTGIADETVTTGIEVVTPPTLTIAKDTIAATQDVVIKYNGSADYTVEDAVIVVNFTDFAGVLVGRLTANDTVKGLIKLSNYGTGLVSTDMIAVRNIAIRKA